MKIFKSSSFNSLTTNLVTEMAYGLGNFEPIESQEFVNMIIEFDNSGKGAQPISFTSVTSPQHRKKGFPFRALYKVGQTNGMIGFDYQANVNAQREREGLAADFTAQANKNVREWLSPSIAITNTGLTALRYRPLAPQPSYFVAETGDNKFEEVNKDEVQPFLYSYSGAGGQGVEEQIQYRLYGIDKIVAVSFQKKEYVITDVDPVRVSVSDIVKEKLKS